MKSKTIIILSQVNFDDLPYTSYVHNHAVALTKQGYKVYVLAGVTLKPYFDLKKYSGEKNIDGVNVIYFKKIGFSNLLYKSKINLNAISYYLGCKKIIKKIINQNEVILIDAHTFKIQGIVASYIKRKYNIKTFVTLHGTSFDRNLYFRNGISAIKKVANSIDYMICVSEKLEKKLLDLGIKNTKVIYNGATNYNLDRNNNNLNIVTVGYFTKVKNFDIVIMAFANVLKKFADARLTIVGDGSLRVELIKLVDDLKINDCVTFTGALDNYEVNKVLAQSNIFVLPSSPEGFGITYVEAMNNGCIAIGTKGEGIDGFIVNGVNGFLTNVNVEEISNRIIDILNNGYDNVRQAGYISSRKLTWENNAKNYVELLGECNENKKKN